ncbi:MAG TPA: multidrug efflux SMR transporter [Gammaproteobacteria bacterium]|nr:multidrug efflux SMR transporter [Gammaproteobacteria bacterium]
MSAWGFLLAAIVLEVAGTTCMKLSDGFSRLVPSVLIFVFYALSFTSLTFTLRRIDLTVAYPVWAGLGTALIAVIGAAWFREPLGAIRILGMALVVAGVVALNVPAR